MIQSGQRMRGRQSAGDVRVMISAEFYWVYSELSPAFARASGGMVVREGL
jgi:hypothetical protein